MSEIPLGKKCPKCGKIHLEGSFTEKEKLTVRKLDHHIFQEGYIGSLVREDQIIEFYSPLVTRRIFVESYRETVTPEKKFFCSACGQEISEETFNEYNSYCPVCYEFWESEEI